MKYLYLSSLVILLALVSACKKETKLVGDFNCANFQTALLEGNDDQLNAEIYKLTFASLPIVTAEDPVGQLFNLNKLVKQINDKCPDVQVKVICYACLRTFPAQSILEVELMENGAVVSKIMNIVTPSDSILRGN